MSDFAIVSTTVESEDEARRLARALVEDKLAACVQIVPITSIYRWKEGIEETAEHLLLCKIATAGFAAIEAAISKHHRYEVPEIVMTPIDSGSAAYMTWLATAAV